MTTKKPTYEQKKANVLKVKKNPGIIILYLSRRCPHCQEVLEEIDKVKANYSGWEDFHISFVEEDYTFLCYGFEEVPTLLIPLRRPYEGIAKKYLVDENLSKLIINGRISPKNAKHEIASERRLKDIIENKHLDYLTKKI